jgi:hypothetical protein
MSAGLERQLIRLAAAMHDARQDLLVLDEAGMREWVSRQLHWYESLLKKRMPWHPFFLLGAQNRLQALQICSR